MTLKKIIGKVHLWLGMTSGLLIVFLGITGCMLAFEREIETLQSFRYVEPQEQPFLPPSVLREKGAPLLPGKLLHSVEYGGNNEAAKLIFYSEAPAYYYIIFMNPYTAQVQRVKNMDDDFFRIIINGHFYLWLPPHIGQPIIASATLVFVVMLITGVVLWWPKNKAARKQRFRIKWNAGWKRKNYDLHYVLGFYIIGISLVVAITGLVWGFQWFAKALYWGTSGGKTLTEFYEPSSAKPVAVHPSFSAEDKVWEWMKAHYKNAESIEVHYAANDSSVIAAGANPDAGTYWKIDYRYFDQYTLKEQSVDHVYGRFPTASVADKIARMNYDIHTGQVLGLPGKILAFFASLIAASLPVTGFCIWWGRKRKAHRTANKLVPVRVS